MVAAVAAERIDRLVLIDGMGPLSAAAEDAPQVMARALRSAPDIRPAGWRRARTLEDAVRARLIDSDLDTGTARLLVRRATEETGDGVVFRHDPRLRSRSLLYLTEDHVLAFLRAIRCPVLAIRARDGWPFPAEVIAARLAAIAELQQLEVSGGHHVHLTDPAAVAPAIRRFFGLDHD